MLFGMHVLSQIISEKENDILTHGEKGTRVKQVGNY